MEKLLNIQTYLDQIILNIPGSDPVSAAWYIFIHGGWIVLLVAILQAMVEIWLQNRRELYDQSIKKILLAIDVPKETEQSPQAVEHIFSSLASTYARGTVYERWWKGKTPDYFSFEIVSLGGYTQFLIRTAEMYRDLIEASIYAQYPDAEVTEVEDYVDRIPLNFDTQAYDLWGTEFQLAKSEVYPIKTYPEFEHQLSQEFKDPMAQFLEILSRINPDEDVWFQILVTPTTDYWKNHGKKEVDKIIKQQELGGSVWLRWFSYLFVQIPGKFIYTVTETVLSGIIEPQASSVTTLGPEKKTVRTMQQLTPGEKEIVTAIERKASKIGFKTKIRLIYWGRRETFLKGRGVAGVVGAIQQYTKLNLNGFKNSKKLTTKAEYFLKQARINKKQRKILWHYAKRSNTRGHGAGFILNTEELATIYHFPVINVKAPSVKKSEVKKAEPPFSLPEYLPGKPKEQTEVVAVGRAIKGAPPTNLPTIEE
ncbi:MAG: hypothetical protein UV57_C0006G0021 [Parcubacteria group bacterium GW2011_GWD2_43_10]|uniref:DUF8128 domain-containing protein n=3 Tax=Candidatus Vebleniibacteriota TaxID=1817921 RepID=A0A1G2QBF0_9BACT|nr:MAG: hypothetical protein UV47_C0003G0006 [Parcubacteria group bacterium GW2011_GWA2_42_80]KKS79885.1 MAG: hypothetical protein UV52_C0001G0012 [Parcubacteria group bacterium GW2011_GWD1_42_9]KKS83806.1 MAG: hypothetical protein UV57_C0006G0021 [Parcubacteria group bacterium GW2011_GWD2_43_10]KKS93652.1 MAG: hypothetical protein UV69_C0005G0011 [Parcubacteria group bacterium GW2011_GWE2_43_12]KKT15154.1 MAG: hypothetical protein UV96_C0018G0010 [Parcubacteria group bacterium GW2011_GWF2_43_3